MSHSVTEVRHPLWSHLHYSELFRRRWMRFVNLFENFLFVGCPVANEEICFPMNCCYVFGQLRRFFDGVDTVEIVIDVMFFLLPLMPLVNPSDIPMHYGFLQIEIGLAKTSLQR